MSILLAPIAHAPRDNLSPILLAVPLRRFVADILLALATICRFFWPRLHAPLATIRRRFFWLRHRDDPPPILWLPPLRAPRGDLSQIRSAVPWRIPGLSRLLWPMRFFPPLRYRHLSHTVSRSSVRRSATISSKHRADGQSLIFTAPTGDHFTHANGRHLLQAFCLSCLLALGPFKHRAVALPFTLRTKTIPCLSASLHLIVASCANSPGQLLSLFYLARLRRGPYSPHNHIIGHCRPHSTISLSLAIAAPSPIHIGFVYDRHNCQLLVFRRTLWSAPTQSQAQSYRPVLICLFRTMDVAAALEFSIFKRGEDGISGQAVIKPPRANLHHTAWVGFLCVSALPDPTAWLCLPDIILLPALIVQLGGTPTWF